MKPFETRLNRRERPLQARIRSSPKLPPRRLTVTIAPAELRKTGASLDLAIAMGILLGSEQVRAGPAPVAFASRSFGSW